MEVIIDFPQRLYSHSPVYVDRQPMTIASTSWHKGRAIIKLEGVDNFDDAEVLGGKAFQIHQIRLEILPEGQYYQFQIIGFEVWTSEGKLLGKITKILSGPRATITYVVGCEKGEIPITSIDDVVKSIDLEHGRVIIEAIE